MRIHWWLTATLVGLTVIATRGQTPPDGNAVRDRLDAYLLDYEPKLSALVADERMTQRDGASAQAFRGTAQPTQNREIVSEVAFIGLPGNAGWLGLRRVVEVNGKKLTDAGPTLAMLLNDGASADLDQARLLLTESARHNLGYPRTTNLPNLPLELLHPRNRHRLRHRVDGGDKIRGVQTSRLILEEHTRPTIIQRPEGGDMQTLVVAWVETTTGRLMRAQVKTRDARVGVPPFDNSIIVDFRTDDTVGLLVPYEMKEEFFAGQFREGNGTARYSNYRRFVTTSRGAIPQP